MHPPVLPVDKLPRNTGSIFEMEPETREAPAAQHGMALAVTLAIGFAIAGLLSWAAT